MFVSVTRILCNYCEERFSPVIVTLKVVVRYFNDLFTYRTFYPAELMFHKKKQILRFSEGKMSEALCLRMTSVVNKFHPFPPLFLFLHNIFGCFTMWKKNKKRVNPPKGGPHSCLQFVHFTGTGFRNNYATISL